jgi:integrase
MTRERRRHFGNVRKRSSGRYQVRYLDRDGNTVTAPQTFAKMGDANAYLSTVEADQLRGVHVSPRAGREKFSDYANAWLDGRSDLRPTTRSKYRHLLDRHLLPSLKDRELAKLSPAMVRAWFQSVHRSHPTTANDAYRLLRAILNTAVADELIVKNPCAVKGAGQSRSPERPTITLAELAAALAAVPERYRLAVVLPAWCQLRRGEVLALQRRHVSLDPPSIRVEGAWNVTSDGQWSMGDPKTTAGVRTLAVPANVAPALADHLALYVGAEPDAWLFPSPQGDRPIVPRHLDRLWQHARLAIGRSDLHLHDLRHSGLTWAAAKGATLADLMHRGGHASPAAALRYQHASADRDATLADALAELDQTPRS